MTQLVKKRLLDIMHQKKSNLAVAADVTSGDALLHIAEQVGEHICILKTHIDIIDDFTPQLIKQLRSVADRKNFLLFEDRKYADIGHTTQLQFTQGIFAPAKWADLVTVHALPGPGILEAISQSCIDHKCGALLLLEMSTHENLLTPAYCTLAHDIAARFPDIITGIIAQKSIPDSPWLTLTPGIKMQVGKDATGQRYNTPETAIIENGTDIIIVGRGITQAPNIVESANQFQVKGWQLYQQRLHKAAQT